jgi:hypothetical protein
MTKKQKKPADKIDVVADAAATAQAMSLTTTLVMTQLLIQWALTQKNPSKRIRAMYGTITRKLDSAMNFDEAEPAVVAEARKMIDELFFSIGRYLDKRKKRG